MPRGERLQKVLARRGYGSRRACEEMIRGGRVRVNGEAASLGLRVEPDRDRIEVDGAPLPPAASSVYLLLNKPSGYVTTRKDPHAPRTVMELLRGVSEPVFPVGRLDADAEGLLLLTNDGDLANRLTHPRHGVPKTYRVTVAGAPPAGALEALTRGVPLEEGVTAPARVRRLRRAGRGTVLEITIREGRKRQVKRMCAAVGHRVTRLVRVRFGPLKLGGLKPGEWRRLTPSEVAALEERAAPTTEA